MNELVKLLGDATVPFILVFARISGIFISAPIFSSKSIPAMVRTAIAVQLAFLYYSVLQPTVEYPATVMVFLLMIIYEILTGALIGFAASIIISAIQAAGEIIDVQMGLSMVQLINPATRTQSSAIGRIFYQLALIVMLTVDAHLQLLGVIFNTFSKIPLGQFNFATGLAWEQFVRSSSAIFTVAVQLALPMIVVLFLIDFSLGIVNRVAQQIDIFSMGMNIKPLVGFSLLLLLTPSLVPYLSSIMGVMAADMITAMNRMAEALAVAAAR